MSRALWRPGLKLRHPWNPDLGTGMVVGVDGRFVTVHFPGADETLTLSPEDSGLEPLVMAPGTQALLLSSDETVTIAEATPAGYRLTDGREVDDAELWPDTPIETPLDLLIAGRLGSREDLRHRLAGLKLIETLEGDELGALVGGRITHYPHQLWTAARILEDRRARWLLADQVGLGKTVVAAMVLAALIRTERAERALVIAPETLVVQWLGELWRKFHQVFVLLDAERMDCVRRDFGVEANPFEVHRQTVVSMELLASSSALKDALQRSRPDIVIVDEAHRLAAQGIFEAVGARVQEARHTLLLTATPLQADPAGLWRLLHCLHPEAYPDLDSWTMALAAGEPEIPAASAVRREDIGGLPPRAPRFVELPGPTPNLEDDPRVAWLCAEAPRWRAASEKALVFVAEAEQVAPLRALLERRTGTRVHAFEAGMDPGARDIEVAVFRASPAPLIICSDAASEGRNFQFCARMVHFSLPDDPVVLEQRIGRLDRIGRDRPVEIVVFHHPGPAGARARVFEGLGLLHEPAEGWDPGLPVAREALQRPGQADAEAILDEVARARTRSTCTPLRARYPDSYRAEEGARILAALPADVESRTEDFCLTALDLLGVEVVEKEAPGRDEAYQYFVELDAEGGAAIPGVAPGARFLGTFERDLAVEREELDFFGAGHALVDGLLLDLRDGPRGRATILELPMGSATPREGLLGLFVEGPFLHVAVVDERGRPRPDQTASVLAALGRAHSRPLRGVAKSPAFGKRLRLMAEGFEAPGRLDAIAYFRTR